jgi:hypothetical protein
MSATDPPLLAVDFCNVEGGGEEARANGALVESEQLRDVNLG